MTGYPAAGTKVYGKEKNIKIKSIIKKNIFYENKFDINGSYVCRVLNSEQNKTDLKSLVQK